MRSLMLFVLFYCLLPIYVVAADNNNGFPFSRLPLRVRDAVHAYDPASSIDTDNPFGFFTHKELPPVETMRLLSDMGLGHAKPEQLDPLITIPLARRYGIDIIVSSGLPGHPDAFKRILKRFKGQVKYYHTDGDEPNNRGTTPEIFVERMAKAYEILHKADPKAKLIMDDLGDEGTFNYFRRCLEAGLAKHIDYASYGYFTWGHAKQLFHAMKIAANDVGIKVFYAPLRQFGNGNVNGVIHQQQKHFIDFFFCGAELINMYKLVDYVGQFGLMRFDGGLTGNYAGFQTLCQFMGKNLKPDPALAVDMKVMDASPSYAMNKAKVERGVGSEVPNREFRLWVRSFRGKDRLVIAYWFGPPRFNWYKKKPSGDHVKVVIPLTNYRYPAAVDLITGKVTDLPYRISNGKLEINNVPIDGFARVILLLPYNISWERIVRRNINPRELKPRVWRTVNFPELKGGDWVTAILPDGKGGAVIGSNPMHKSNNLIVCLNRQLKVRYVPEFKEILNGFDFDMDFSPGSSVVSLLRKGDKVYVAVRGSFLRFNIKDGSVAEVISPPEKRPLFKRQEFTSMNLWRDRIWLSALGTAREGNSAQGEGVSAFDPESGIWQAWDHIQANGLTGSDPPAQQKEWSGRITGLAVNSKRVWISAMQQAPSYFDGTVWHQFNAAPKSSWCVAIAGDKAWFGGDNKIFSIITGKAKRGKNVAVFDSSDTGLPGGRVLNAVTGTKRVWFTTRYRGVASVNIKSGKWKKWLPGEKGLPESMVQGILPVKNHVWLWTWGGGIARLDKRHGNMRGIWKRITRKEGLADNRISTVVEDKNGAVWVGTFHGLSVKKAR